MLVQKVFSLLLALFSIIAFIQPLTLNSYTGNFMKSRDVLEIATWLSELSLQSQKLSPSFTETVLSYPFSTLSLEEIVLKTFGNYFFLSAQSYTDLDPGEGRTCYWTYDYKVLTPGAERIPSDP